MKTTTTLRLLRLVLSVMMLGFVSCKNDSSKPETPTRPSNTKKGNVENTTEAQRE